MLLFYHGFQCRSPHKYSDTRHIFRCTCCGPCVKIRDTGQVVRWEWKKSSRRIRLKHQSGKGNQQRGRMRTITLGFISQPLQLLGTSLHLTYSKIYLATFFLKFYRLFFFYINLIKCSSYFFYRCQVGLLTIYIYTSVFFFFFLLRGVCVRPLCQEDVLDQPSALHYMVMHLAHCHQAEEKELVTESKKKKRKERISLQKKEINIHYQPAKITHTNEN